MNDCHLNVSPVTILILILILGGPKPNRRADKDSYRHDRRADSHCPFGRLNPIVPKDQKILSTDPTYMYCVSEEKSPYFLFHGETALRKILRFLGETANFSEKFQGEIAEFLREIMELYRQNLKISGRNTGVCWRKYWISWRNFPLFLSEKRQLIMKKNKMWGFFFTCTVCNYLANMYYILNPLQTHKYSQDLCLAQGRN